MAFIRGLVQHSSSGNARVLGSLAVDFLIPRIDEVGAVFDKYFDAANLPFLFVRGGKSTRIGSGTTCRAWCSAQAGEVLAAEVYESRLVSVIAEQTAVFATRFIGFALFAIALSQAEQCGSGD